MILYHATYRANLRSIRATGLGAKQPKNWDFSEDGVVCLCDDAEAAFSFCECADEVSDYKMESGIIVFALDSRILNRSLVEIDSNLQTSDGDCKSYTYRGIIPSNQLYVTTRKIYEENLKPLGPLPSLSRVPSYE